MCRHLIGPTQCISQHGRGAGATKISKLLYCRTKIESEKYLCGGSISNDTHATNHGGKVGGHAPIKQPHIALTCANQNKHHIPLINQPVKNTAVQDHPKSTKTLRKLSQATTATIPRHQTPRHPHEFERHKTDSQLSLEHSREHATHRKLRCGVWVLPNVSPYHKKHLV